MPRKSRAEIQKAYRERQKQKEGEQSTYKERERARKRDAYIPVSKLDEGALKKRRLETQSRVEKYRNERKQKQIVSENAERAAMRQSRETRSTRKSAENALPGLIVKLNFNEAKKIVVLVNELAKRYLRHAGRLTSCKARIRNFKRKHGNSRREFSVLIHHQRNQKAKKVNQGTRPGVSPQLSSERQD